VWIRHLSSLQFLTYVAFFAVVVASIVTIVPGRAPPLRHDPYPDDELGAHDRKLAKYFVAGGGFLVLGRTCRGRPSGSRARATRATSSAISRTRT